MLKAKSDEEILQLRESRIQNTYNEFYNFIINKIKSDITIKTLASNIVKSNIDISKIFILESGFDKELAVLKSEFLEGIEFLNLERFASEVYSSCCYTKNDFDSILSVVVTNINIVYKSKIKDSVTSERFASNPEFLIFRVIQCAGVLK